MDRSPRRSAPARAAALLCIAAVLFLCPLSARAAFTGNTSDPQMTVTTGTLAAATGLAAANGACVTLMSTHVNLSWTATSSTFADGYEILRGLLSGGPYTSIGTVSGRTTTTYTDTTPLFSTTYRYVVRATKLAWRSANSNEVSITTLSPLCL